MMGIAGWIIIVVGTWGAVHNNHEVIRFSGGASWMTPSMRRWSAIFVVLFGGALVVGSFFV